MKKENVCGNLLSKQEIITLKKYPYCFRVIFKRKQKILHNPKSSFKIIRHEN